MLFNKKDESTTLPLVPYVFKLKNSHLIGYAYSPETGSPCTGCMEHWLKDKEEKFQKIAIEDFPARPDLLKELEEENSPHVLYEIHENGTANKIEASVFPHPSCACKKNEYKAPEDYASKNLLLFSPIKQIRSARFATNQGNVWVTYAEGVSTLTGKTVGAKGSGPTKEASRTRCLDLWFKRVQTIELPLRLSKGEILVSENFQTQKLSTYSSHQATNKMVVSSFGVGGSLEEAIQDGLQTLCLKATLQRFVTSGKNPMMVVNVNFWLKDRVPMFILQSYDLHLLFYPNASPCWIFGLVAFSRVRTDEKPIFIFATGTHANEALEQLVARVIEQCPSDDVLTQSTQNVASTSNALRQLNLWWVHWIYRCPKIDLKDLLNLEPYTQSLDTWRSYFQDGQNEVSILRANSMTHPAALRTLVCIRQVLEIRQIGAQVRGIATWTDFQAALA